MEELDKINSLIFQHLQKHSKASTFYNGWKIGRSPISKRGVISTRDYKVGEIIFIDFPVVFGPRATSICPPVCIGCYKTNKPLLPCSVGCRLPVCSPECENSSTHSIECNYLCNLGICGDHDRQPWSNDLLKSVTPIRCLALDDTGKQIVHKLHKIIGSQQSFEVNLLKKNVRKKIAEQDENFMRLCCCVMDANAYEISLIKEKNEKCNLRGLFPLASIMNHKCSPNTSRVFGSDYQMIVRAAIPIKAGTEITTTYSSLFLCTPARRNFLSRTKHFLCECKRCSDPTEFGTHLSGINCRNSSCNGMYLPISSLDFRSSWSCTICSSVLSSDKIGILQKILANNLSRLNLNNPEDILEFLKTENIPTSNHLSMELKLSLIRIYGNDDAYKWEVLSDDVLELKKQICNNVLEVIHLLQLGQCRIRGFCLCELYLTIQEINRRSHLLSKSNATSGMENCPENADLNTIILDAVEIYKYDIFPPLAVRIYLNK